jgi:RecB family exonuclease
MRPPISFWSYSSLTTFEACPYRVWLDRIDKQPRPERDDDHPINRGLRVHKAIEDYITGQTTELTPDAKRYADLCAELRAGYDDGKVEVEAAWWFTKDWTPCSSQSNDRWFVVKTDATQRLNDKTLLIVDWKTGKSFMKEVKHGGQMHLYAAAAFTKYPEIEETIIRLVYLDEAAPGKSKHYLRPQLVPFIRTYSRRGAQMMDDVQAGKFPPKPNKSNCKFCDFGPSHGTSACAYGVE